MIGKLARLMAHPGFRRAPLTVLGRAAALAWRLRGGEEPRFALLPGGPVLQVPADRRYTTLSAFLMREHAEPELAALQRFVAPGDGFIDVGANIGLFALKGAHLVGRQGRVLAVEPGAASFARLVANLALNDLPQLIPVQAALSDRAGEMALYHIALGDDPQAFSLLPGGCQVASETVRVITLDQLARDQALERLDCIKIDVEGAEPMVIAGGGLTLARFRPIIIFEINAPQAEGSRHTAAGALTALGYRLHQLRGADLVALERLPESHGNLIAIHPSGPQPR